MDKILDATYDGEVFRPNEPIELPSNTKVKVIVEDEKTEPKKPESVEMPKKGEPYSSLAFMASLNLDGPEDFSRNIDEYLYGGKTFDDEK